MHTVEKNIVNKLRSEVDMDSVMTTVETRVQRVILRVELAMNSDNASSGRGVGSVMLDPDQRDFPGNIENLQMTVSIRIDSHTDLIVIDEARGNIAVEGGDLSVNGRYSDRRTHTHHRNFSILFVICWNFQNFVETRVFLIGLVGAKLIRIQKKQNESILT